VFSIALDGTPQPVIAYLAAEQAKDARSLAGCFAEDGTVHDEGRDYHGRAAIQRWKEEADAKYRYALQPISARTEGETTTVLTRLTGDFPGSPVDLNHIFTLSRNEIVSLEIRS
jgi:SnoaL-like domain